MTKAYYRIRNTDAQTPTGSVGYIDSQGQL